MSSSSSPTPRAQPFYCPYCGEEDIVPSDAAEGARLCNFCGRHFVVRFLGLDATTLAEKKEAD